MRFNDYYRKQSKKTLWDEVLDSEESLIDKLYKANVNNLDPYFSLNEAKGIDVIVAVMNMRIMKPKYIKALCIVGSANKIYITTGNLASPYIFLLLPRTFVRI